MDQKLQVLIVHTGCVLVIVLCFGIAELTPINEVVMFGSPLLSRALEVAGFWLWGKLGFKPAEAITAKIIASMDPEVVRALSTRPPDLGPLVIRAGTQIDTSSLNSGSQKLLVVPDPLGKKDDAS